MFITKILVINILKVNKLFDLVIKFSHAYVNKQSANIIFQ